MSLEFKQLSKTIKTLNCKSVKTFIKSCSTLKECRDNAVLIAVHKPQINGNLFNIQLFHTEHSSTFFLDNYQLNLYFLNYSDLLYIMKSHGCPEMLDFPFSFPTNCGALAHHFTLSSFNLKAYISLVFIYQEKFVRRNFKRLT